VQGLQAQDGHSPALKFLLANELIELVGLKALTARRVLRQLHRLLRRQLFYGFPQQGNLVLLA
jgi:hypothetical protein